MLFLGCAPATPIFPGKHCRLAGHSGGWTRTERFAQMLEQFTAVFAEFPEEPEFGTEALIPTP